MSEITINTDEVIAALVAKMDTSDITMAVHAAVDREVKRVVTAEVKTSIKDAVRAAVAEALPAMQQIMTAHVDREVKVRARRFAQRLERAAEDE